MKHRVSKVLMWVAITIVLIVVFIAFAGMYKFNYLSGQEGYDVDGNKIEAIK